MKVAYWYNNKDIRVVDAEKPIPDKDEILIKVHSCGICGSDLCEWYRLPRAPLIPGHEMGGEIVEIGSSVKNYKIGERVCIVPKVSCGVCKYCKKGNHSICPNVKERLPGAFAEYLVVPKQLVNSAIIKIPDDMSYDVATFIEPLACVIRAQRFANIKKEDKVLIIGAGMTGILHVKLALLHGANVTAMDINEKKLSIAKKLGANVINSNLDIKQEYDAVIVCSGALPAFDTAWKSVDMAGAIILFAVPGPDKNVIVPINDFWRKEVKIIPSYYCGPEDIKDSFDLINSKKIKVDDMITHRFPLERIKEGFEVVQSNEDSLKVIIDMIRKN